METKETDHDPTEEPQKKGLEDKLDDFADKFSHAMSEGVKRMESAFDKSVKGITENPDLSRGRIKGFFSSSAGGGILIIVGIVWFFYAIGLLSNPVFPALLIVVGFYIIHRSKKD